MIIVVAQSAQVSPTRRDLEESLVAALLMEDGLEVTVISDLASIEEDSTDQLCLDGIKGNFILLSWHRPPAAHDLLAQVGVRGRQGKTRQLLAEPTASQPPTGAVAEQNLSQHSNAKAPGTYDAMARSIYCLDFSDQTADWLRGEIRRIISDASVKTFSLDLGGPDLGGPDLGSPDLGSPIVAALAPATSDSEATQPATTPQEEPADTQPTQPVETQLESPAAEGVQADSLEADSLEAESLPAEDDTGQAAAGDQAAEIDETDEDREERRLDSLVDELDEMDW